MSTRLPGARYKRIFDRGRSIKGRLLVAWHLESPDADRMAGVVVSKKSFHDAVDRNRAKRQLREAYRRHKYLLTDALADGAAWHVAFIWLAEGPIDSRQIDSRMQSLLRRMAERIAAGSDHDGSRENRDGGPENHDDSHENRAGSVFHTPSEP